MEATKARRRRVKSISNLYSKKFDVIKWITPEYERVFGGIESSGCWLIWGGEKNGKTRFALMLANELTKTGRRVLYISAEEGLSKAFIDNCQRSGLEASNRRLQFDQYIELEELTDRLQKRNSADVVFIDNATIYEDEIKKADFKRLLTQFKDKIFVLIAHEERKKPYTAIARLCNKLANAIMYTEGLACHVSGRVKGGELIIDERKALIYYGEEIKDRYNDNQ